LWLQRIALIVDIEIQFPSYELLGKTKQTYANDTILPVDVWNSKDWLDSDFYKILKETLFIDKDIMNKLDCIILQDELGLNKIFSG